MERVQIAGVERGHVADEIGLMHLSEACLKRGDQ